MSRSVIAPDGYPRSAIVLIDEAAEALSKPLPADIQFEGVSPNSYNRRWSYNQSIFPASAHTHSLLCSVAIEPETVATL